MTSIRRITGLAALLFLVAIPAFAQTSFTNATAITITDCPNPCPASGQAASLYPSPIVVSGVSGPVERVSVTITGFSHAFPADTDFLLVSPSGRKSVLMSDFGAGSPGVSSVNVTFDDYAARPIPSTVTGNTGVPFVTGSYRPANSGTTDLFPAAAPAAPYTYTLSAFNGDEPNGTWELYIIDDANLDGGSISGGWTLTFDARPPAPTAGQILISEFRTRGAGTTPPGSDGSADEFIEIYNNTDNSITIIDAIPGADPTSPTGAGWRIAGAQGAAETTFLVLSQTLSTAGPLALPPHGYFLISTQPTTPSPAGNTYSLSTYPTGTGITASGSANISINPASATVGFLPDDVGLAVFSTAAALSANRLDSVGYGSVTAADYYEGTRLAPAGGITTAGQHSWTRRLKTGYPQDTGDNAADFQLVDTTAAVLDGQASTLGAPGPERGPTMTAYTTTSAPIYSAGTFTSSLIDNLQPATAAPNQVRDLTPVTNGANGTFKIRRRYTNNTGLPVVALRYRIVALTTLTGAPLPAGQVDLRVLNSPTQTITLTDTTDVTAQALTVQTPAAQASGGGVNSSLAEGVITTTAPLANGASTVVEFNFGVQSGDPVTGDEYLIVVRSEALTVPPNGGGGIVETFTNIVGADLSITKTDGVATATPGGPITYVIQASNAGPDAVTGATVTDTFPAALIGALWTCSGAGGGTCTANGAGSISDTVNLPAGGSVTYTVNATIDASATGTLVNTAEVAAPSGVDDPNTANNSAIDTDTLIASVSADLSITKTDGVTTVAAGGSVIYTVTASNAGPDGVTGVTVTDTFPVALAGTWTCAGAGGATCTAAGSGSISDTVNLPSGGSVTYTINGTVNLSATGNLVNTAAIEAPSGVIDSNTGNNSATDTDTITPVEPTTPILVISEFRLRGPSGANDEFIEIMNNSAAPHAVSGGGTGYALAASDGTVRCVIPNGTVLPPGGRYLCVNSVAYSLSSYPAGDGSTATGDATYTTDIPDNAGLALFSTSEAPDFAVATRLDAVGSTAEANTLYKEGTGYSSLTPFSIDYSFHRDQCGKGGSITTFGPCPNGGAVVDTGNNAADFVFVDTNGTSAGAGQRLGAPGPQNFSSPLTGTASMAAGALDPCVALASPPNKVRDFTSDPANNSTFGTLDLRARYVNNTGVPLTRLRFRVVDLTTFPAPSGIADLRPRTSSDVLVTVDRAPCGSGTDNITVQGTILEQPPSQPNGGGFNSSLSVSGVTTATPLADGAGVDVRFLLGIQQTGSYKLGLVVETLPIGVRTVHEFAGCTDTCSPTDLQITKTDGVTTVAPGGSLTYTIIATNNGAADAHGVAVTDVFPTDFTGTWTCAGTGGGLCTEAGSGSINETAVALPVGGSVTYTVTGTVATGATGPLSNTATVVGQGADSNGANNSATDTDTVILTQTITFANPGAQPAGGTLALIATASSGLPVTFASTTPAVCTVAGTTASLLAAGTCSITASQAGNATYLPAPDVTQSFAVSLQTQTITFANPGEQTVGAPLTLTATATSGLTVALASTTAAVCTVSGTTASLLTAGTCTIVASQAGNATYAPAAPVTQSFTVSPSGLQPPIAVVASVDGALVTLRWEPAASGPAATQYLVEVGDAPGATSVLARLTRLRVETGVLPRGRYHLRVRALNDTEISAPSAEVIATVNSASDGPAPPVAFNAQVVGNTVSLAWRQAAFGGQPESYLVEVASQRLATDFAIALPATTTGLVVPNVPPGRYIVRVRARSAAGLTPPGPEIALQVGALPTCTAAPQKPVMLTPVVAGGTVAVTWLESPGERPAFVLEAGIAPSTSNLLVAPIGGLTGIGAVVGNGDYAVRVTPQNPCGDGPASAETLLHVDAARPAAPTNLAATVNAGTVTFTWTPPTSAVIRYVLEAGIAPGSTLVTLTGNGTPTLVVPGVPPGRYVVRVRAVNANGIGTASTEIVVDVP